MDITFKAWVVLAVTSIALALLDIAQSLSTIATPIGG